MSVMQPPEAQVIENLRGGVGHARTRLNALQAQMDSTVGALRQRQAETLSQVRREPPGIG